MTFADTSALALRAAAATQGFEVVPAGGTR
jgi:hypothetical protein